MARRAQVDDQLVRIAGRGADEFGVPDRREVAVAGQRRAHNRASSCRPRSLRAGARVRGGRGLRGSSRGSRDRPGCSVLSQRGPPTWVRPVGLAGSAPPALAGSSACAGSGWLSGSPRFTTLSAEL